MVNKTIRSLYWHLIGLPVDVPITVTVDGLHPKDAQNETNVSRLWEYIHRLNTTNFPPFTNVTVFPMPEHLHIARSVKTGLSKVDTKYVYVLQHDLTFSRDVYHTELLDTMDEHPDTLRIVLFKLEGAKGRFPECPVHNERGVYPAEEYGGLDFYATKRWSDNNHLTTRAYYEEMFANIDHLRGAIEWGMMAPAKQNCSRWGQVVYGRRGDDYLQHLDGRHSS